MIKVAICDDTPYIAESIKKRLITYHFDEELEVDCFEDGLHLYAQFIEKKYEIVLTDIELTPDGCSNELMKNGMLLADEIKEMSPSTIVIFLSRFSYEKALLRHEPFAFIDKPMNGNDKRIIDIVGKAILRLKNRAEYETIFWYKSNGVYFGIEIKKIIFIESNRPKIRIVSINGDCSFRGRLDKVQENIDRCAENFMRVSKSFYINMNFIKSYTSQKVTMTNDAVIPISRKYLKCFRGKMGKPC